MQPLSGGSKAIDNADLHLSAVTLGEIQTVIELTRDQDAAKAAEIEHWADQVAGAFNVLPINAATLRLWTQLMHPRSDTLLEDAMIAATAKQHRFPL